MPLRLKSLELHGYKTFAARTFFEFAGGITAVVGPNGAGKSNIADALRWVLGEQSYSLLRGKKTEDMIFSGSEHRPRAGMASAEVVFDNSAKWLPVDYSEVAMTRRAYRDGHNDYLLNGQHVRLRDMNELLAAAGLSERTYTMVGQGLVDASLALNPDERRRLFEEAAGVGLYRIRREEALKRLETTLRNLERVQDIMTEIEPRLKTLERQAKRAKEVAAAQADLREVLREWYGYHWHTAQQDLQKTLDDVRGHQERAAAARQHFEKAQSDHGQMRSRLGELRANVAGWHREAAALHQERESVSLSLAVLDERRRTLQSGVAGLAGEQERGSNELTLASQRLEELEAELTRAAGEAEEAAAQLKLSQDALQTRQSGRGALENDLQSARDRVAGLSAERAEVQARLDTFKAQMDYQQSKIDAAQESMQAAQAGSKSSESELRNLEAKRAQSEKLVEENLKEIEGAREEVDRREAESRAAIAERAALVAAQSRLQAQLQGLEQAEQMLTGYADGTQLLLGTGRQLSLKIRGALSSLLELPANLEIAIAAALGEAIDSVIIEGSDVEQALELLESQDAGRAVLMPLGGKTPEGVRASADADVVGIASQLVRVPAELRSAVDALLGSTLVVRNRAAARRLHVGLPPHARVVTLRGEVFRADGLITAGRAPSSVTLSRPREKREIQESLSEMMERLQRLEARVDAAAEAVEGARAALSMAESELEQHRKGLIAAQSAEHEARMESERQTRLADWHKSRLDELRDEIAFSAAERQRLAATLAEHESVTEAARARIKVLSEQLGKLSLDEAQELVAYWSTRAAVTQQTTDAVRMRRDEHASAIQRLGQQFEELRLRAEKDSAGLKDLDSERAQLMERERELQAQIGGLQAQIEPAEVELERWQQEEGNLEEAEVEAQRSSTSADRTLNQFEIDLVRRQEALESLRTRIVDDFGLVSFEYAANVEGPVPLPFEGLVEELHAVSELRPDLEDQLNQRRARLRRLGLINPEAARDYESESERYSFLSAQVQDLRQAEADLRQVIAELDEMTRKEFSRTYAAVDKQFREIFTRLFGGGSARLALTDPDNLIETGIEIEARLPGRREQGLSLLSGGERSLTAIALVFALLKVSPTPVCVLDEVDAMLDEANVGRFRDLLAELSQDTQFVVITHNRNTVQAADYIYGVTMGRDSTSQIISLRLDEVSEEMLGTSRV
ncbi:MAG TPA: chromosome segregation protein SMC [Anaerolineales bacterium]